MVEFLSYSVDGLSEEVVERARESGVNSKEAWDELVDEIIDEHINWGEVDVDDDVNAIKEALEDRWKSFEEELLGKDGDEKEE
jgi:acetyl-CoA carboxylase alpha subunit